MFDIIDSFDPVESQNNVQEVEFERFPPKELVNGKKNVINFNKEIFAKFPNIKIKMLNYFLNAKKKIISCEILVCLDKRSTIKVVDIIFFDKNWKIKKIYAFKG